MFVLDTNVVFELRKVRSGKADAEVAAWASEVPSGQLFVSSITIHELERGVLLAERADPPKGVVLRRWLDDSVAAAFDQRVLAVDASVARRAAAVGSSIEPITIPPHVRSVHTERGRTARATLEPAGRLTRDRRP